MKTPMLSNDAILRALRDCAARPKWTIGAMGGLVDHCQDIASGKIPTDAGTRESAKDLLNLICKTYRMAMEINP